MVSPAPSCTIRPSLRHDDAVGHRGGVRVVRDHHDGLAEVVDRVPQQAQDLVGRLGVQVAGRLVGEHHRRAVDQRTRHGDALLLAAGQLGRAVRQAIAEPDGGDQRVVPLLVGLLAGQRERQDDVLLGGEDRYEVEGLEDEAETIAAQPREALVVEMSELVAVDDDGAGARLVEPGEQVHERGLAGAGRAHDRGELAAWEAGRDVAEGVHCSLALPVDARELSRADDRGRGGVAHTRQHGSGPRSRTCGCYVKSGYG